MDIDTCPEDSSYLRATGRSRVNAWGKLLLEYVCTFGHAYWIPAG
jgi:hypothetical protein